MNKFEEILFEKQSVPVYQQTPLQRERYFYMKELHPIIESIVKSYMTLFYENKMLAIESLFRFASREVKDQILSGYKPNANSNGITVRGLQG